MKKYLVPALLSIAFVILLMSLSPTIPVQNQPQPLPTLSPTPTETQWQTYRNEKYGFEFQYPTNFAYLTTDDSTQEIILLLKTEENRSFEDFAVTIDKNKSILNVKSKTMKPYMFNDIKALKDEYIFSGGELRNSPKHYYKRLIFAQDENVIDIHTTFLDPPNPSEIEKVNQILSTFKFISTPTPTPTAIIKAEKQLGYIKKVYTKNNKNYIDIDYVQSVDDDTQPNHFRIDNVNSLIRTLEVSKNAGIYVIDYNESGMITPKITFDELINILNHTSANYEMQNPGGPYDIKLNQLGQVSEIRLRYIP